MTTIYYKVSVGRDKDSKRIAYIKHIESSDGEGTVIAVEGIGKGTLSVGGKKMLISDGEVNVTDALSEGVNRPVILDKDGHVYKSEGFLLEDGRIKRAPVPDGFPAKVAEAFESIDRELMNLECAVRELAKNIGGDPLFKFK